MVTNKENKNTSRHTLTNKKMLGDDTSEENKCSKKALQLLADIIPWHVTKGNMYVVVKNHKWIVRITPSIAQELKQGAERERGKVAERRVAEVFNTSNPRMKKNRVTEQEEVREVHLCCWMSKKLNEIYVTP